MELVVVKILFYTLSLVSSMLKLSESHAFPIFPYLYFFHISIFPPYFSSSYVSITVIYLSLIDNIGGQLLCRPFFKSNLGASP